MAGIRRDAAKNLTKWATSRPSGANAGGPPCLREVQQEREKPFDSPISSDFWQEPGDLGAI